MVASSSGDSSGTSSSGESDDGVDMSLRESLGGVLQKLRLEAQAAQAIVALATMVEAPHNAVEYISKRVRQTKSMPLVVSCLSRRETALCALHVLGKISSANEIGREAEKSQELIRELRGFEQVLAFIWESDHFLLAEALLVLRHFCAYPEQQKQMKERGALERLQQLANGGSGPQVQALAHECRTAASSNKNGVRSWIGGRTKPPTSQRAAASTRALPAERRQQQPQPQQQQQQRPRHSEAGPARLSFRIDTGGGATAEQIQEYFARLLQVDRFAIQLTETAAEAPVKPGATAPAQPARQAAGQQAGYDPQRGGYGQQQGSHGPQGEHAQQQASCGHQQTGYGSQAGYGQQQQPQHMQHVGYGQRQAGQ